MSTKLSKLIYQVKITLQDNKPPIWRRLLIPESVTLYQLHQIIQIAMGWTDSHLHQFIINDECYSIPSPEDWRPILDERQYKLSQIAPSEGDKFVYEYDFGDGWGHMILVEKIQPSEPDTKYPFCIKGKRACPPEDIGGVWGYLEFEEAMKDTNHDKHAQYLDWWGGEFDAEEFDIEGINKVLQRSK